MEKKNGHFHSIKSQSGVSGPPPPPPPPPPADIELNPILAHNAKQRAVGLSKIWSWWGPLLCLLPGSDVFCYLSTCHFYLVKQSNSILMSYVQHRVTSRQSNSVMSKCVFQNFVYVNPFSSETYKINPYTNIKQNNHTQTWNTYFSITLVQKNI